MQVVWKWDFGIKFENLYMYGPQTQKQTQAQTHKQVLIAICRNQAPT